MKGRTVLFTAIAALAAGVAPIAAAQGAEGCVGARTATAVKLTVLVNAVRSSAGEVAITVYPNDRRRFLAKGGKLARERVKAAPSVRSCFWVPPGSYAVAVYHDADRDRDFDRTVVGLPAEGFGFSNDPETKIGLPPLSAVQFKVEGDLAKPIRMKYLK